LSALELLGQILCFDPSMRVTVTQALEHPWLSTYHDPTDEPDCPVKFEQWRDIECLETMEGFREAIWKEIEDYRREVRGVGIELSALSPQLLLSSSPPLMGTPPESVRETSTSPPMPLLQHTLQQQENTWSDTDKPLPEEAATAILDSEMTTETQRREAEDILPSAIPSISPGMHRRSITTPTDPMMNYGYVRRSSIPQPSHQGSSYSSPLASSQIPAFIDSFNADKSGQGTIAFPTQGYVVPARSRTGSTVGGEVTRRLLRTLSTVSIHESRDTLPGGVGSIGKFMSQAHTEADAPPSEVTKDFGIKSEGEEEQPEKDFRKGRFTVG